MFDPKTPTERESFAFDFDGMMCEDWSGRDEEGVESEEFILNARPRWLPRRADVSLVVTARLEKHREGTLDWLARHGIKVRELRMAAWPSTAERRQYYNAGEYKGKAFALSHCELFIESDHNQAKEIFEVAKKAVLCPLTGTVFQ